jgi:hypothetical protein
MGSCPDPCARGICPLHIGGTEQVIPPYRTTPGVPHALGSVEIYDPKTNGWSWGPSLRMPRWGLSAVLGPDGKIYAIGGSTSAGPSEYNPFTGRKNPLSGSKVLETRAVSTSTAH